MVVQGINVAATGFVSEQAGSVASANAILLRELLSLGNHVTFFSKSSFVDPRPAVRGVDGESRLRFVDCTNQQGDAFHRMVSRGRIGFMLALGEKVDSITYNKALVRAMRLARGFDVDLWLGDWARGRSCRPTVSFVQGPPGTDARSIDRHRDLIERLAGRLTYLKLATFARWRLGVGLPDFTQSDHIVLGSSWSVQYMIKNYGLSPCCVHSIPYPIDLKMFIPGSNPRNPTERLRLLWLGRFAPRKRLDLFLDGLALAIRNGCDVEAWVIGQSAFVPNYETLLSEFPFPDRLKHWPSVPRLRIPSIMSQVDVMVQPSDDENFGSAVAEALACGVPAIVGSTNGTGDYICERSIKLMDDHSVTLAAAIFHLAESKKTTALTDRNPSRLAALRFFSPAPLAEQLQGILNLACVEGG